MSRERPREHPENESASGTDGPIPDTPLRTIGFALVAQPVESARVGTVTGFVGAAGAWAGTSRRWSWVLQILGTYALGFVLLAVVALGTVVYTGVAFRDRPKVEVG